MLELTFTPHVCDRSFRIIPEKSFDYKLFVNKGKPDVVYFWRKGYPQLGDWFFRGKDGGEKLKKCPEWVDWDPQAYHQKISKRRVDHGLSEREGRELALEMLNRIRKQRPATTVDEALKGLSSEDVFPAEDTSEYAHLKESSAPMEANEEIAFPKPQSKKKKLVKASKKITKSLKKPPSSAYEFAKGITYRAK